MEADTLTKQELIDYLGAFEYDRLEMVELTKADRSLIINALETFNG